MAVLKTLSLGMPRERAKGDGVPGPRRWTMPGGWTRDGAVQDQIEHTVEDAVEVARARLQSRDEQWSDIYYFG
jgi:hypothetical protein